MRTSDPAPSEPGADTAHRAVTVCPCDRAWSSRSSSPAPASSPSRRRPRARRRPVVSDRRAASSTDRRRDAGTFLAAGSSPAGGRPVHLRHSGRRNNGESGTWSFSPRPRANGTVPVPYHWTGLHAWFNVTARLDAVVVRGGVLVSTTNLVNAGPRAAARRPRTASTTPARRTHGSDRRQVRIRPARIERRLQRLPARRTDASGRRPRHASMPRRSTESSARTTAATSSTPRAASASPSIAPTWPSRQAPRTISRSEADPA